MLTIEGIVRKSEVKDIATSNDEIDAILL